MASFVTFAYAIPGEIKPPMPPPGGIFPASGPTSTPTPTSTPRDPCDDHDEVTCPIGESCPYRDPNTNTISVGHCGLETLATTWCLCLPGTPVSLPEDCGQRDAGFCTGGSCAYTADPTDICVNAVDSSGRNICECQPSPTPIPSPTPRESCDNLSHEQCQSEQVECTFNTTDGESLSGRCKPSLLNEGECICVPNRPDNCGNGMIDQGEQCECEGGYYECTGPAECPICRMCRCKFEATL